MNATWTKLAWKLTVWATVEIALNMVGLDNIADYSEFIKSRQESLLAACGITVSPSLVSM
jgi:hypothetical protein